MIMMLTGWPVQLGESPVDPRSMVDDVDPPGCHGRNSNRRFAADRDRDDVVSSVTAEAARHLRSSQSSRARHQLLRAISSQAVSPPALVPGVV